MIKECKYCNKNIEDLPGYKKGAHIRNCKVIKLKLIKKNHQEKKDYNFNCKKCNKEYTLNLTEKEFNKNGFRKNCSRNCANSSCRKLSDEIMKERQSKLKDVKCLNCLTLFTMKHEYQITCCYKCTIQYKIRTGKLINFGQLGGINSKRSTIQYNLICKNCSKEFIHGNIKKIGCCRKCTIQYKISTGELIDYGKKGGQNSAKVQFERRRSKNEIYFYELCFKHFVNVENNKAIFNNWDADIIIHDIKYAVLWNGAWHYKKITQKHSVTQVQNRDKIKISEIIKFGYTPYIIKDMGKYNTEFVEEQFDKFIEYLHKQKFPIT
jgi:hypothetical protein